MPLCCLNYFAFCKVIVYPPYQNILLSHCDFFRVFKASFHLQTCIYVCIMDTWTVFLLNFLTCPVVSSVSSGSFFPSIRQTPLQILSAHIFRPSWNYRQLTKMQNKLKLSLSMCFNMEQEWKQEKIIKNKGISLMCYLKTCFHVFSDGPVVWEWYQHVHIKTAWEHGPGGTHTRLILPVCRLGHALQHQTTTI